MASEFAISLEDVRLARERIKPYVRHTPIAPLPWFGNNLPAHLLIKLENLQVAGSFKSRGAFNHLLLLTEEEKKLGVIAASGGNHGCSVVYAASRLGVEATIVLPETATLDRVQRIASLGGTVVPYGQSPTDALKLASKKSVEEGKVFIHPFDGERTWQGTGTLGLELLEDVPDLDCVLVAIGGGGLISGVASVIKQHKPDVRIIGVEPTGAATMYCSIQAGKVIELPVVNTIADTLAPRKVAEGTYAFAKQFVDSFVLVTDEQMLDSMKLLWRDYNQLVEPAGAAVIAAVQSGIVSLENYKRPVAILCGANASAQPTFDYYSSLSKKKA